MKPTSIYQAWQYPRRSTASIMMQVMLSLVPGTVLMMHWLGPGVLINWVVLIAASVLCEATVMRLRQRSIKTALNDGSIVLAAWLLALCIPPSLPISQLIVGAVTLSVLGKHVYGGLGQNPFNPAMVGYAVLLISFPKTMTLWFDPNLAVSWTTPAVWADWWNLKWFANPSVAPWDSITQATPLDRLREFRNQSASVSINSLHTSPWRELSVAWLMGGVYLLARGVIRWHIPVAVLTAAIIALTVQSYLSPNTTLPVWSAMLYGGMVFGAFYVATDPVTAPSSVRARLLYGASIGLLSVILRTHSNYPEGFAFAVLLMNASVPLLDRWFVLDKRS